MIHFSKQLMVFMLLPGLLFVFQPESHAQSNDDELSEKLETFFNHFESNDKFMGTIAVSIDGKVVFDRQYGFSALDKESRIQPDSKTQYRIGSITKMFTSVMILQLVEAEKLSLDSKLSTFFPDLKNADKISIEQMLGHRSGLGSVTDDPEYLKWNNEPQTREQMMERIAKQPEKFQPGERTEYSNTNYLLLGYIIESLTGSSYAEELQDKITNPLGLNRTAYATRFDPAKNVAMSFTWANGDWQIEEETDASIPHGAGAIVSTPSDLIVFIEALFAGKLINESSLLKMSTMVDGMGLGMFEFPLGGKKALGHNGGIDGFQSNLAYFPEEKIAVAMIGNGFNYPMNTLMIGELTIIFGGDAELPSFVEVDVDEETLKRYEGVYSAKGIPLKIAVKLKDGTLTAQGSGQSAFPLTPTSDTSFEFKAAGVMISFSESKPEAGFDSMQLKQGGQKMVFTKD